MSSYLQEPSWQQDETNPPPVNDPLAAIYNENQWRVNKVSPLFSLQYGTMKLKQYASKIRQDIASLVAVNTSFSFKVQFEAQPLLKYTESDSDGLMITVSLSQEKNNLIKTIYSCILMSWGVSSKVPDATHLPYMLERGEQKVSTAVKKTLQKIFDCHINQFTFTQHHLLQFGYNFVENETSRSTDPFVLKYTTPQVDNKEELKLTFCIGDVQIIWNGVKKEVNATSELVNLAYQMLQNQIIYMMNLDITALDLCEISLPKAEVKRNSTVKMKTPEMVNTVFTVLNEICDIHDSWKI